MYKFAWDRDYHTITDITEVTCIEDIEDDWTGYNFWYRDELDTPSYSAEEARKKFIEAKKETNDQIR